MLLLRQHAELLHEVATQDLREIDRSREPESQKTGLRQKVRRRLEPYPITRKRLDVSALCSEADEILDNPQAVQEELLRHWAPIFSRRALQEEEMDCFAQFLTVESDILQWACPHGAVIEKASRMPRSAPGPDGPPYHVWADPCRSMNGKLIDIAESLTFGASRPSDFTRSYMIYIPKREYEENTQRVVRKAAELRPLKLMQTSAKLMAAVADDMLGRLAEPTVCPAKGF